MGAGAAARGEPVSDSGFEDMVGFEERSAGDGRAEIVLLASEHHLNASGVVHGGAIAAMVDLAMGRAVNSMTRAEERPVTIEMKVNYLEAGKPGELVARAQVLRRGRLFTVAQAEVEQVEDGETLAEAMGTFTTIG